MRAFHALPTTPNSSSAGLAELPTSGAAVRRELSASACAAAPCSSPPLAPPVKRFCRSLTEDLPRPKPLRPTATNNAELRARPSDHLSSLIATRRLPSARASAENASSSPKAPPLASSFVPYPQAASAASSIASSRLGSIDSSASVLSLHSALSSGYGSGSTASLLESTLSAVEPELEEIEAAIPGGGRFGGAAGGTERPHAPSPDSRALVFDPLPPPPPLPLQMKPNPALTKEKYEGNQVYRLIGNTYILDQSKTGEDFFTNGARALLYELPEVREHPLPPRPIRPSLRSKSPLNVPVQEDSEGEREDEDEVTLMEDSRRSSRNDFEDLDLESMEKDDSWPL